MQKGVHKNLSNLNLVEEKLSTQWLEKGEATKFKIADLEGDFEVEILRVDPHTKIKNHRHEKNWEIQINLNTGEIISVCKVGESHELENNTDKVWNILCIKGNNGVPLLPVGMTE